MTRIVRDTDPEPLVSLPSATGGISRLACARAEKAGLEIEPLLRKAGLTIQQIQDRDARISVKNQIKLLTLAANDLQDTFLGFHLACDFEPRELGLLHYVMASSDKLGDALQRAARYSRIVNEGIVLRYLIANNLTVISEYHGVARHSDRHQIEFWITALVRICRELTGMHLLPHGVQIVHRRQEDCSEFNAYVGCDIEFGAMRDAVVFPRTTIDLPVIGADRYLNDLLIGYCEQALAQRMATAGATRSAVENAIIPLLPHERICADDVARKLGMSRRTLARKLASEGLSFGVVVDQLRRDLAKRHIKDPALSISQIAWLLGFQEVSTFTHAFKRWTGMTPSKMRLLETASRRRDRTDPLITGAKGESSFH